MIGFFAHHQIPANLLTLLSLAPGVARLPTLKRETFPGFAPGEVEIRVPYPGASAEDVEDVVCVIRVYHFPAIA